MSRSMSATLVRVMTGEKDEARGRRVVHARERRGYTTQPALAKDAGLSIQTIFRAEDGRPLSSRTWDKIAKALRVSPLWLLHGVGQVDGEQPREPPKAVEQYLSSEMGKDCPADVAKRLRVADYAALGAPNPGVKEVHRLRELIELNLSLGRKRTT